MMIEFDIADDDKLYAQFLVTMRKERKRLRQRFCPQCQKDLVKFSFLWSNVIFPLSEAKGK